MSITKYNALVAIDYLKGWSVDKLAEKYSISPGAVRAHLQATRDHFGIDDVRVLRENPEHYLPLIAGRKNGDAPASIRIGIRATTPKEFSHELDLERRHP